MVGKKLAPIWETVATELKGQVNVAKVDVPENRPLGEQFGVKGFPTVKFFRDGDIYDYSGQRSVEGFKSFVSEGYKSAKSSKVATGTASTAAAATPKSILQKNIELVAKYYVSGINSLSKGVVNQDAVIVLLTAVIFVLLVIILILLAVPSTPPKSRRTENEKSGDDKNKSD
jgi:hypothetical protein